MSRCNRSILVLTLFAVSVTASCKGGLRQIGKWHVEVGPPGNDFYQPPAPQPEPRPPSDELFKLVRGIAPAYAEVKRWELMKDGLYLIRAEAGPEEYDFHVSNEGRIRELRSGNDSTGVREEAQRLVLKGTKKSIPATEVPEKTLKIIGKTIPDASPSQVWEATTFAGKRFVLVVGGTVFYARPDGQIQAIGLIESGALKEIDPSALRKRHEEILAQAEELLGRYKDRFNVVNQLKKLGEAPKDGRYRYVVMGDSRSNPDLWSTIVRDIDRLDPKPNFVISTGDIVHHGYAAEYRDYYIPPLLNTEIPFFVAAGNHDDGDDGTAVEYRYLFGDEALNYYFDYGTTRYVLLDNVTAFRPYREALAWLDRVLAETPKDHRIIVVAHKPVATLEKWAYHAWDEKNSRAFAELMSRHKVQHVFFGHIHAYSTATFNGVDYTVTGGGGAGLHDRFGPQGNVHHYVICDVLPNGTVKQQVARFYEDR